jgi:hypothetical protein
MPPWSSTFPRQRAAFSFQGSFVSMFKRARELFAGWMLGIVFAGLGASATVGTIGGAIDDVCNVGALTTKTGAPPPTST